MRRASCGETSGRRYAFLTIFAKNGEIFDLLSADFHVLALFDLESGAYHTGSRFDLPPTGPINLDRINVTCGASTSATPRDGG